MKRTQSQPTPTLNRTIKKKNETSDKIGTIQRRVACRCARMTRTNQEMDQILAYF